MTCSCGSPRTTSSNAACSIPSTVRSCPTSAVFIRAEINGKLRHYALSRQMVLFSVERRKSWRMLQSKAGVVSKDYLAQKALLKKVDAGEVPVTDLKSRTRELFQAELTALGLSS